MCVQAIYQSYVVLLRDQFGQQKLSHSRLHFHTEDQKKVFSRHNDESQEQFSRQTNPGFSMLSLCMTFKKKQPRVGLNVMKQHFCTWSLTLQVVYTDEE